MGDFKPNWASLPGDTITDILGSKNLTLSEFSTLMDSDLEQVNLLLQGFIAINDSIAVRLNRSIGGSKEFWLRREAQYRESVDRIRHIEEAKWVKELPTTDMFKFSWIEKNKDLVASCLNYFAVPDVWTWRRKYSEVISAASFRKSEAFVSTPAALATWIRQGEIQAEQLSCQEWNANNFEKSFDSIKKLTKVKDPKRFIPLLRTICAQNGVALTIAPTPKGCSASGVAKFISSKKAMILLSFRYKTDDHFWFTFFHEVAHLLLHSHKGMFIEEEGLQVEVAQEEFEANSYAANVLIPEELRTNMTKMDINERSIKRIALAASVSLGIVVGQLQHLGKVPRNHYNGFKRKYDLSEVFYPPKYL